MNPGEARLGLILLFPHTEAAEAPGAQQPCAQCTFNGRATFIPAATSYLSQEVWHSTCGVLLSGIAKKIPNVA